jgi:hypothetical protein
MFSYFDDSEVSACSDDGIFDGFKMSPDELENTVFWEKIVVHLYGEVL